MQLIDPAESGPESGPESAPGTGPVAAPDPASMSGLEMLRLGATGRTPVAGIGSLLGMALVEVDEGTAAFELTTTALMTNPMGQVHGGIAATMLDSALGCSVHTTLAPGEGYATTDLHVHFVRPVEVGTPLRAVATVTHRGRRMATAEGRVHDDRDRLVAHASTTCMIFAPEPH